MFFPSPSFPLHLFDCMRMVIELGLLRMLSGQMCDRRNRDRESEIADTRGDRAVRFDYFLLDSCKCGFTRSVMMMTKRFLGFVVGMSSLRQFLPPSLHVSSSVCICICLCLYVCLCQIFSLCVCVRARFFALLLVSLCDLSVRLRVFLHVKCVSVHVTVLLHVTCEVCQRTRICVSACEVCTRTRTRMPAFEV